MYTMYVYLFQKISLHMCYVWYECMVCYVMSVMHVHTYICYACMVCIVCTMKYGMVWYGMYVFQNSSSSVPASASVPSCLCLCLCLCVLCFPTKPPAMAPISVGDSLPDGTLSYLDAEEKLQHVSIHSIAAGKKVVLFGVPGAFTPTCRFCLSVCLYVVRIFLFLFYLLLCHKSSGKREERKTRPFFYFARSVCRNEKNRICACC